MPRRCGGVFWEGCIRHYTLTLLRNHQHPAVPVPELNADYFGRYGHAIDALPRLTHHIHHVSPCARIDYGLGCVVYQHNDKRFRCPVSSTRGIARPSRHLDWPTRRSQQPSFACEWVTGVDGSLAWAAHRGYAFLPLGVVPKYCDATFCSGCDATWYSYQYVEFVQDQR